MRLLRDREYLPYLIRVIEKARREIEASIFLIDPGRGAKQPVPVILKALQNAQKRGVRIRIATDNIFWNKPSGKRLREEARQRDLSIEWDDKHTVLHEKTVRIDGRLTLLGSHNWTSASLLENHELSIALPSSTLLDADGFSKNLLADI